MNDKNKAFELIKYEEENIIINVYLLKENNTIWLTQKDMTILFDINKSKVSRLLSAYIKDVESGATVSKNGPIVAKNETVQIEGNRTVKRVVDIYNFDVILYVGNIANPKRITKFKSWVDELLGNNTDSQIISNFSENSYELVRFEDGDFSLDVNVSPTEDTVWLTQSDIALLFDTTKQNISTHINNIFTENELDKRSVVKESLTTAQDGKQYLTYYYNLDVILSVGYRVKSLRGNIFRRWVNSVLKEYLLKGYKINENRCLNCTSSIIEIENKLHLLETKVKKIEDKVSSSEFEIIYEGDVVEAKILIRSLFFYAKKEIIIIDGYADSFLLELLSGIDKPITIITFTNSKLNKINLTSNIKLVHSDVYHDRFIIVDETSYLIGSSINTMGRKRSVMCKLNERSKDIILEGII